MYRKTGIKLCYYLGKPGGSIPFTVSLQVTAGIQALVNQAQQLHSLCKQYNITIILACVADWQELEGGRRRVKHGARGISRALPSRSRASDFPYSPSLSSACHAGCNDLLTRTTIPRRAGLYEWAGTVSRDPGTSQC